MAIGFFVVHIECVSQPLTQMRLFPRGGQCDSQPSQLIGTVVTLIFWP